MDTYPGGYVGFGIVAMATHAMIGYTLGTLLFDEPAAGVAGALLPDCDIVLEVILGPPFTHRGVTHTVFAGGLVMAVATQRGRDVAGAVGLGYLSHLLIDVTTPKGVMLAYPVTTERFSVLLRGHSPRASALVWSCCLLALWYRRGDVLSLVDRARD